MTEHVIERILGRMREVDFDVDLKHLRKIAKYYADGKYYVGIGKLDRIRKTTDGSVGKDVVAIVYYGQVKTIMLSLPDQRWDDGDKVWWTQ